MKLLCIVERTNKLGPSALLLFVFVFFSQCSDFPKDPERTLQTVQGGTLQVGITENQPWTNLSDSLPQGVEVKLLEAIAQDLKATIQWHRGSETELVEALRAHELHLMIGGLSKKAPWAKEVGFTRPYKKMTVYVGVPPERTPPDHIKGVKVGVAKESLLASYVKEKGGIPIKVEQLEQYDGPVAAYDWKLQQMGWQITDIQLHEEQKVLAVTRGENAWVMYLEEFIDGHQQDIDRWLLKDAEQ